MVLAVTMRFYKKIVSTMQTSLTGH